MYRLIVAILLLAVLACSALDIGRSEPMLEHHYAKWWIYLTHWALIACALQAWLAAIIVTKGLMIDRNEFGKCLSWRWSMMALYTVTDKTIRPHQ